jgi:hypothetical protein
MSSLPEALRSPRTRGALEDRGVFTARPDFLAALAPPGDGRLAAFLGLGKARCVTYVAQQVYPDYPPSVTAKFAAARDLSTSGGTAVAVLWHDMDRAGSDRQAMRFVLPLGAERAGIWLASRKLKDREPRFIPIDRRGIEQAIGEIGAWLDRAVPGPRLPFARARLEALADVLLHEDIETLAQANRAAASYLLRDQLGFEAPGAFTSEVAGAGLLTDAMNALLAHVEGVVSVFNAAREELLADGIDPGVQPLSSDYLPVRYSCPRDGVRIRLRRETEGARQLAVGACRCGADYRFDLGTETATLGELEATARWSPDITLPILLNGFVSGVVAGRSSAAYGLVLGSVLARALNRRPVPTLLPPTLAASGLEGDRGLLHDYLTGWEAQSTC